MKWYNKANTGRYKKQISYPVNKEDKESELIDGLLPWMPKLAIQFNREYASIGILDLNDLIQLANYHLVMGVRALDWSIIDQAEENDRAAVIWKYIKRRCLDGMRQDITYFKDGIRSHRRNGEKRTNSAMDNFLTQLFPDFFDDQFHWLIDEAETSNYQIDQLAKGLDHLMRVALTQKEKFILELFYGIDCKPVNQKEIADMHKTTVSNIQNIKHRAISKLKKYHDNRKIIEHYYDI